MQNNTINIKINKRQKQILLQLLKRKLTTWSDSFSHEEIKELIGVINEN